MKHVKESEGERAVDGLIGRSEQGPKGWENGVSEVAGRNLGLKGVH